MPEQLNEYDAFKGKSIDELVKNYQKYDLYDLIWYLYHYENISFTKKEKYLDFLQKQLGKQQDKKIAKLLK